jgi:hypothetical protein
VRVESSLSERESVSVASEVIMSDNCGISMRCLTVPKAGETRSDDFVAVSPSDEGGLLCVSDGATESSYSAEWAEILVNGLRRWSGDFINERPELEALLHNLQEEWNEIVPWDRLRELGYPFLPKAQRGAHASVLAVRIRDGLWEAVAVGDCNLFIIDRAARCVLSWPAQRHTEFGSSPVLLSSILGANGLVLDNWLRTIAGKLLPGETLIICSDAVAAFLLERNDPCLWDELLCIDALDNQFFGTWIDAMRSRGMKNDDCSVAIADREPI